MERFYSYKKTGLLVVEGVKAECDINYHSIFFLNMMVSGTVIID